MTVRVVVDSASSLPVDLAVALGITVVPMSVVIDEAMRPDSAVPMAELLEQLVVNHVTTSGPTPGDFTAGIERALESGDEVLVLTLSAEMSSTFQSATVAAATAAGTVRVVDTRSAAGGEGLVAIAAARAAKDGASLDEVERVAANVADRVHLVAALDDLDHLARSGRVPNIARRATSALHIKPLFEFRAGSAHALTPAHGDTAARHRIVERCLAERPVGASRLHVATLESQAADRAKLLLDAVLTAEPDADWFSGEFGPVMVVHVGPGLVGLAWWWEPV